MQTKMDFIDLRSDTVTIPTRAMRGAMMEAQVGDDVSGEDPTVNELEAYSAKLLGKEAGLFVPSGTFANQCALLTLTSSGNEVLLAERCHIIQHEAGAASLISRVQLRPVSVDSPHILPDDIRPRIRDTEDIHYPKTGLICVEQATADGVVVPLEVLAEIKKIAEEFNISVYMDGARIFNAAAALGCQASEIAAFADVIGFCLSKGLCAPVGSVLVGTQEFIDRARGKRKILGGGMRQVGVLAGPGLVALREIRPKLAGDHERAKLLAKLMREIPGVHVLREPEINMVFATIDSNHDAQALVDDLLEKGIKIYPDEGGVFRFVTHQYITDEDIQTFSQHLREALH